VRPGDPKMPKQLVPKAAVAFLLSASAYGTAHLAQDYLQAVFGTPDAQWQWGWPLRDSLAHLFRGHSLWGLAWSLLSRWDCLA
jgi:hypothetical protein